MRRLDWRKQPRQGFIPTKWIGSHDGRDLFSIEYHVQQYRHISRSVSFYLRRMNGQSEGSFAKLKDAKAYAEFKAD